jgi:5-deoxy-glucuronate isomerase
MSRTSAASSDVGDVMSVRPIVATQSGLHRRATAPGPDGATLRIDAATERADLGGRGWHWISFSTHLLETGASVAREGDGREVAVVVLDGSVSISAAGRSLGEVGGRQSVFDDGPAPVVLVEPGLALEITALGAASVALAAAPGGDVRETRLIDPGTMRVEARGSGMTTRTVRHLLPAEALAGRLILVEVVTPGGNWSSYPPHKHDTDDPPRECLLEELYYYRFALPQGFAFQRVYTPDRSLDEALTPMDGDVVLVPRGYHPVAAAAGYDCYYLNVMAGPVREWRFTLDPDHAWLMDWSPDVPRG